MDLIIINGYTPPSPNKYDVDYSNVNGASEQLENGYTYIEQVRAQVPKIALAWTNITEDVASAILSACQPATFTCKYYFGTLKQDTFSCDNPKLTLKLVKGATRYYNLSITLKS